MSFIFHRNKLATALGLLLCGCGFAKDNVSEVTAISQEVRDNLDLAPSHQKRIEVGGFSILGSSKVSDFALKEAAFLIRRMIGGREDLLAMLSKNKTRFVIMARDEYTTDVPEHSNLKPAITGTSGPGAWVLRMKGLP
jgi:hypothetical protein